MAKPHGGKPLKQQNGLQLALVLITNLAVAAFFYANDALPSSLKQAYDLLNAAIPAGLGLVAVGVVNELLSQNTKARLVFWRWSDPLPGSEAFTRYGPQDVRQLDIAAIERKLGASPRTRSEQNRAWYSLYKTVKNQAPVVDAHKSYLFLRDYAAMAAMMAIGLPLVAVVSGHESRALAVYSAGLALQYVVVRWAAANAGRRLVTNAMACYLDPAPAKPPKRPRKPKAQQLREQPE